MPTALRTQYKNLTLVELQGLRWSLYVGSPLTRQSGVWVEGVLRFCELNMWCLDRRMREQWGKSATLGTVATAALLLEGHLVYGDSRLLNAVLKIRKSRLFRRAKKPQSHNVVAALAVAVGDISEECVQRYHQR